MVGSAITHSPSGFVIERGYFFGVCPHSVLSRTFGTQITVSPEYVLGSSQYGRLTVMLYARDPSGEVQV